MADVTLEERQALGRATKAEALLRDPELNAAFDAVKAAIVAKFEECPVRDAEGLQILRLELKLLGDLRANIEHVVNTGKVIRDRISFLERVKKGARTFVR